MVARLKSLQGKNDAMDGVPIKPVRDIKFGNDPISSTGHAKETTTSVKETSSVNTRAETKLTHLQSRLRM